MKYTLAILALFAAAVMQGQFPFNGMSVQEVTIPATEQATIQADGGYAGPVRCWRVYACMSDPNWEVQAMFGFDNASGSFPWILNTSGDFWQSGLGSDLAPDINEAILPFFPELAYDSWFSLGNDPYNGTISGVNGAAYDPYTIFESGSGFNENTYDGSTVFGAWPNGLSEGLADAESKILVAQFTSASSSVISGTFNFQFRQLNPDGSIFIPTTTIQATGASWSNITDLDPCPLVFLPLTLTSFSAKPEGEIVRLNWNTLSEQNVDYFGIERSKDGSVFEQVGSLEANGTTQGESLYFTHDANPLPGASYYRLRIVDTNGAVEYSDPRRVDFRPTNVSLYPNPSAGTFSISGIPASATEIRLLDSRGLLVDSWATTDDNMKLTPDISRLAAGVYMVEILTATGSLYQERLVMNP